MHLVRLGILRKVASIIFLSGEKSWRIEENFTFLKRKSSRGKYFHFFPRLRGKYLMSPFLKFRDEQDALGLKFLRPSVTKFVFWPIRAN